MKSLLYDLTDIGAYPVLKPATMFGMQSSYDRKGGNDDGFAGTYSVLSKENGNAVIAEIKGVGALTRIWFPIDIGYPDVPMGLRNKRIYIYLDGSPVPAIDMPIVGIFNNTNRLFPYPLCSMALGGCWCYLPLPFNNGARIVVQGDKALFFQVQYNTYSNDKNVETFDLRKDSFPAQPGKYMNAFWDPGNLQYLLREDTILRKRTYNLKQGINTLDFIEGPATMRALKLRASATELAKCMEGNIIIFWDDATAPANGLHGRSLLAGMLENGEGVYNYFPMPYRRNAKVQLQLFQNCTIELTTVFSKLLSVAADLAYLHINYTKDYPTKPGKKHIWLEVSGEGHFAGVYMRAASPSMVDSLNYGLIYWTGCLEGDEVFEVDGRLVAHGTGTEDYFNAGWNGMHRKLDHPQLFPTHGFTVFDAHRDSSRIAAYRWHMPTEVFPFKKHFKASIEVGPTDNLPGNYESTAFYYLTLP